jgi:5-methylcytosine-specific restriction endonuclease McrA
MTVKVCRGCGAEKDISGFYAHTKMADGHLHYCKSCCCAKAAERAKDPARIQRSRDWHAAWRAANPERWKEIRDRAVRKNDAAGGAERRKLARRARTDGKGFSVVSLRALLDQYGRTCGICGKPISESDRVHWDHIVPLSRGGAHVAENLRPSHGPCNAWKHNRLDAELVGLPRPAPAEVDAFVRELRRQRRSDAQRALMAAISPEERAARGRKISASKTGKKMRPGHKSGGARTLTPEQIAYRTEQVRLAWTRKTPEEMAAHAAKIRAAKAKWPV